MSKTKNKVTREIVMLWGVKFPIEIRLPAGLRVKPVEPYPMQTRPEYFLAEFPVSLPPPYTSFPIGSFYRHDAIHYGIRLTEDQVQESEEL